jgi:predicted phage-related endonuclease
MSELYSKSLPLQVELPAEASLMIADLEKVKSVIKELETRESIIKADLGKLLQEAEEGVIDGEVVITWKEQKRTSFDSTRFDKERPELAKLYKKDSKFRVMKTKGRK